MEDGGLAGNGNGAIKTQATNMSSAASVWELASVSWLLSLFLSRPRDPLPDFLRTLAPCTNSLLTLIA